MFFGKQKFDVKQLKLNKFIFDVKQLKINKFIFDVKQLKMNRFTKSILDLIMLPRMLHLRYPRYALVYYRRNFEILLIGGNARNKHVSFM